MVARRAWVVAATLNYAPAYVGMPPGAHLTKVITMLKVSLSVSYVAEVLRHLDAALTLDLSDQRSELTRLKKDGRLHHMTKVQGGVDIYLLSYPIDLRAQKATIRKVEEDDEGEWLEWKADSYNIIKVDPPTHHISVAGRQDFDWKRTPKFDFEPKRWF